MAEKEIDLRRLVIKAFHMTDVEWGEHNNITTDGHMTVSKEMIDQLVAQDDCIEKIDIQIIKPGDHDRWTNTIMDIIPISTKVLGKLGEGITHTITGVYVMLTGVDEWKAVSRIWFIGRESERTVILEPCRYTGR